MQEAFPGRVRRIPPPPYCFLAIGRRLRQFSGHKMRHASRPSPTSASFLMVPSRGSRVGCKVGSVTPVSTRIWQGFPFISILISPWLFKGMTGGNLPENPSEVPLTPGGAHMRVCKDRCGGMCKATSLAECPQSCSLCRVEGSSGRGVADGVFR